LNQSSFYRWKLLIVLWLIVIGNFAVVFYGATVMNSAPSLRTNRGLTGLLLFRHTLSSCRATRLSRRTGSTQRSEIFTLNLVTSQNSEEFCVVKDGRWAFW
jgi:hypothetical protein